MINTPEVDMMYRLRFRKPGVDAWNEGSTFSDEKLTPEAKEMLAERYARQGLETDFERVLEEAGDQMGRGDRRLWPSRINPTTFLSVLLVIGLLVNLVLATTLTHRVDKLAATPEAPRPLSCQAIPTKLILEDPACADKLLRAMNVANVRVLPYGSAVRGIDRDGLARIAMLLPQPNSS